MVSKICFFESCFLGCFALAGLIKVFFFFLLILKEKKKEKRKKKKERKIEKEPESKEQIQQEIWDHYLH